MLNVEEQMIDIIYIQIYIHVTDDTKMGMMDPDSLYETTI
jgi:hypothetical protein